MKKFKTILQLIKIFFTASVSAQLEYRANFITNILAAVAQAVASLVGLSILFADGLGVGGWSFNQSLVVLGVYNILAGVIGSVFIPNLGKISEAVRLGAMDFHMLKPVDTQFLISFRNINLFRFVDSLIGCALLFYAWQKLGFSLFGLLPGFVLMLSSLLIVYAILFALATTAFWFVNVENVLELFFGFFTAASFPVTAFPKNIQALFTFVIPIAFISTVPAQTIIGVGHAVSALQSFVVAALLLFASRLFWKTALRSYTSASS